MENGLSFSFLHCEGLIYSVLHSRLKFHSLFVRKLAFRLNKLQVIHIQPSDLLAVLPNGIILKEH